MQWRGWKSAAVAGAVVATVIAGCTTPAPDVGEEWEPLLNDVRAFERRIGFVKLDNFQSLDEAQEQFTFCGYASRFELPYSYEDPAIHWMEAPDEVECRRLGRDYDVYFGAVEALGEIGVPVTPDMVTGKFDRFLYLIIHEDCHDEFDFPYGIEEAICNLITYRGMESFGREKYWRFAGKNRAIRRYADDQLKATRATIAYYDRIAALYARYARKEIGAAPMLQERDAILLEAAKPLGWTDGEPGMIRLANDMTYSRHYPMAERVHAALGRDLAKTVAFFKHVDAVKPAREAVLKHHRLARQESLAFIKAYEAAIVETVNRELPKYGR